MGSRNENSSFTEEEISSPVDRVVSSFQRDSLNELGAGVGCRGLMKKMGREVNGCGRDVS